MKPSSTYQINIFIAVVFGILGFSGLLIGSIFTFQPTTDDNWMRVLIQGGLGLLGVAIYLFYRAHTNFGEAQKTAMNEEPILMEWKVTSQTWLRFLDYERRKSLKNFGWIFFISLILLLGSVGIVYYSSNEADSDLIAIMVASGFGAAILIFGIKYLSVWLKIRHWSQQMEGHMKLTANHALINQKVISWNVLNQELSKVELIEDEGLHLLALTVYTRAGKSSNYVTHFLPLNSSDIKKADDFVTGFKKTS